MPAYEVRVEGELADSTLQSLRCAHTVVEEQTLMRLDATASELEQVLKLCSQSGWTIERVVRVENCLSRGPARGPGGPRRRDG